MVLLSSPFSFPLHVASWFRPTGSLDYRVTNTFDGEDGINGGKHRAVDVGNFRTGQAIRAPRTCRATGRRHFDGALGVEFDLGFGLVLGLWHLNRVDLLRDLQTEVSQGRVVGLTGNTGPRLPDGRPMPAHTHVEIKHNGIPIDPEPYLPMVERGAIAIPLEDDMEVKGANLRHIRNRRTRTTIRAAFRAGPGRSHRIISELSAGARFFPIAEVDGEAVGTAPDRTKWLYGIKTAGVEGNQLGCLHSSVLERTADGSAVALEVIERVGD